MAPLARWSEPVYAVFRIVVGLLFLQHGAQKLLGWPPGGHGAPQDLQGWIGAVLELSCGTLVCIGLFAGWAAFIASGMMAVAYFQFHEAKQGGLPIQNQGELAVVYCFAFLLISAKGAGIWSLSGPRPTHPSS